ncbi:hypothetical protein J5U22_01571 [Saccharolobus shibatae]|uniref:DsrE/DsrF-like family protein n=2 Tax=Saccharolobus shibatae TaxID=2286 RepID=A0A8F5GWF9_9CREN|nr:hypothetical protein J5U21_01690 [Saccharolobus shibatae]QXJ35024.1 hypothetical protein J5U22_01571 [Saccharolobus shibatae]
MECVVKIGHAVEYAKKLKKMGHEVYLFFDGLGTRALAPQGIIAKFMEEAVKEGLIYGACGYCASPNHVNVKPTINVRLLGDENNHIGVEELVDKGYQLVIV